MMDTPTNQPILIYENKSWMVFNKPSGWHSVHPGRQSFPDGRDEPNVEEFLRENYSWADALPECGIVHRLDYLTSGCLLVAWSENEQKRLRSLFRSNDQLVVKSYYAVVTYQSAPECGEFTLYFSSRYRRSKKITVSSDGFDKQRGRCRWRIQKCNNENDLSHQFCDVLAVEILGPGKRHQIRAGLAHLGYPIHGDELYGGLSPWRGGFGLHAFRLQIDDMEISCPPPISWNILLT